MRLVFFGSGEFGLPTLQQLVQQHDLALVVSQPDRPAGRSKKLTPTPIAEFAHSRNIPTFKPEKPNDAASIQRVRDAAADAFIVIAYGHKLSPALLDKTFAINLHASLLPKYRGAAPINWAMINGEAETGVSVITLAQTMDAGLILGQSSTPIQPDETAGELHDRLATLGPPLIEQVLNQHAAGTLTSHPQNDAHATRAPKFTKADGTVRFDQPALAVRNRVHGLTPWPGCTITLGGAPLRLLRVAVNNQSTMYERAGLVLADGSIACSVGSILPLEVQPPGGNVMPWDAYRHGHRVAPGMIAAPMTHETPKP